MATININWAETDSFSVSEEASQLGFNLRLFQKQPVEVQAAMKKAVVDRIIEKARETWRESIEYDYLKHPDFNAVKNGVYVISVAEGFAVRYKKATSAVMYIGRGVIANRLRSHLNNWIFDMSRSLRDVPFSFHMEAIGDNRSRDAFKDFEHLLLDEFVKRYGEKPLVNKIHGREGHIDHKFGRTWDRPIAASEEHLWEIRPSKANSWFKEFADD